MKKRKSIIIGIIILATLTVTGYGYSIYNKYRQTLNSIVVVDDSDLEDDDKLSEAKDKQLNPFAVLLFGISARENDIGRADTIMLALIDPEEGKIQLISIPRDSYVEIPGYGKDKINSAFPRGGPKLLKESIENLLDIDIHAYTSINFQGFIELVDIVNGIDVFVSRNMVYDDPEDGTKIRLEKGQQVLDGKNALDFVRFRRSNDGNHASDYARMKRQQEAMTALVTDLTSIRNISDIYSIMDILSSHVRTNLSVDELDALIKSFLSFNLEDLYRTSLEGGGHYENGAWYEKIPDSEIKRVQDIITEFLKSN